MSYHIKTHGFIGAELQRVAVEEISAAEAILGSLESADPGEGVHEARKHFKKLGALVQLLREPLGAAQIHTELASYREAGRSFHRVRDPQALLAALEKLTGRFFEKKRPAIVLAARRLLLAEEQRARRALVRNGVIETVLVSLHRARQRAAAWDLGGFRWKELRAALRRSFRRARQSWRHACDEPKPRCLHEWRRGVKDLFYHLSLVHSAAPEFLEETAGEFEVLGEFLGDDHDLVVLRKSLENHPTHIPAGPARDALFKMLELRREELLDAAFDLAGRVFDESPGEFIDRLEERRDEHRQRRKKANRVAERLVALG